MSRSPSPASSLDFAQSSGGSGSEEEYTPVRRKAPTARKAPAATAGKKGKKGKAAAGPLKINLSALRRAQAVTSAHPAEGPIEDDEEFGEGEFADGLIGARGVDLSGLELKADHAARPLWVDEHGNMYAFPPQLPRWESGQVLTKKYPGSVRCVRTTSTGVSYRHC
jgi:DNA excision repair protein ERCC-3